MENNYTKVGVGVMVLKDGKVLLGKRKGSHGEGEYSFPGGHLEYMESFEECAQRETTEEAGIEIKNIRLNNVANIKRYDPKHYVHIGLIADWKSGEPQNMEPDKHDSWGWFELDKLPEPLFAPCVFAIEAYKSGQVQYFDNQ